MVIYYLLGTSLGYISVGYLVGDYYSKRLDNKIEISSLNIERYPYILAEVIINDTSTLLLSGEYNKENMNLSYHLKGDSFKWNQYILSTPTNLKGKVGGKISELLITGDGTVLSGDTAYAFVRKSTHYEKIQASFKGVNSKELLKFFKREPILMGNMDINLSFEKFTAYRKKGLAKISMKKATMPKVSGAVEFTLDAEVTFKDLLHEFFAEIHSNIGKLRVANGYYNQSAGLLKADYGLHINELSYFEKFLKHKYYGSLNTAGSLKYEAEKLLLKGDSTSYEGLVQYIYRDDALELEFKGVSLEKILRQLSFPALLSAKVYGSASYNIKDEIILVNTQLRRTRFRRTKMTDTIYNVSGINILKDIYDDSVFTAGYQDSVLTSLLKIDNGVNHLYLKDTRMNSKTNAVSADFEVQIDGQEFFGEVYGTLDNPQVNLDMSKLIKYQINKKIENFFGTGKVIDKSNINKNFENLELDNVEEQTRSFLEGFFD